MYYSKINKCSVAESPGISVVLFVSGCLPNKCKEGNCPGCHNKEAQKFNYGKEFTSETKCEILDAVKQFYINNFVLCGGEIFDQDEKVLVDLVQTIKELMPEKSIWCYTGYEFDQIKDRELTKLIDVAVCGPFKLDLRDISADNPWRGSTNQYIIDVKQSLAENRSILLSGILNNTLPEK